MTSRRTGGPARSTMRRTAPSAKRRRRTPRAPCAHWRPAAPNEDPKADRDADDEPPPARGRRWRLPALVGGVLALLLLAAFAAPPPFGIAERDARIERIRQLTDTIAANPRDVDALGELADLYLAGGTADDVGRALASLVLMRDAAPQSRDANQRLVTLLVRTGLWDDADAAIDHYADVVGEDDPDIPFFRGLVARGNGDNDGGRPPVRPLPGARPGRPAGRDDPRPARRPGERSRRRLGRLRHALQRLPQRLELRIGDAVQEVAGHATQVGRRGRAQPFIARRW